MCKIPAYVFLVSCLHAPMANNRLGNPCTAVGLPNILLSLNFFFLYNPSLIGLKAYANYKTFSAPFLVIFLLNLIA